jgi:hypothetical protein
MRKAELKCKMGHVAINYPPSSPLAEEFSLSGKHFILRSEQPRIGSEGESSTLASLSRFR